MTPIPFRVRIGITGRRTLSDEDAVRAAVRQILQNEIGKLFDTRSSDRLPTIGQIQFEAITALADGTDQVVAEEIRRIPGSTVTAVLPLEESEYRATISAAGIERFETLLNADREPHRMRRLTLTQEFPGLSEQELEHKRDAAYDMASRYIVDHCDVLIAIWDPAGAVAESARQAGDGTKRTVEHARKRGRPIILISPSNPSNVQIERGTGLDARALPSTGRPSAAVDGFVKVEPP